MGNTSFNPFDPTQLAAFQQAQVSNANPGPSVPSSDTIGSPQQVSQIPQPSPSAPSGATAGSQSGSQPQPGKGGSVKAYLMEFLEGFGNRLLANEGVPTPFERQNQAIVNSTRIAQANNENAEAQYKAAQTERIKGSVPVDTPNGRMYLPPDLATKIITAQQGAQAKTSASVNSLRGALSKNGYDLDLDESGIIKGIKPLSNISPLQQAQIERQEAEQSLAAARADLLTNPHNPTYQQKERQIQAQLAMANQRIQIALQGNQRQNAQFGINNGVMPDGSTPAVVGSGQAVDATGNPIGKNFQNLNEPTAATRASGTQAGAVASHIPDLRSQIDNLAAQGKLGALNGRINTWLNSGYGGDDPDIAKFISTLSLINSGTMKAHFGARGGAALMQGFKSILNSSQEPKAMKGSLDAFESFLNTYKEAGTPKTNRAVAPASPAPASGAVDFSHLGGVKR